MSCADCRTVVLMMAALKAAFSATSAGVNASSDDVISVKWMDGESRKWREADRGRDRQTEMPRIVRTARQWGGWDITSIVCMVSDFLSAVLGLLCAKRVHFLAHLALKVLNRMGQF